MSFFIFQLSLFYVHQIDWSTYLSRVCFYRISLSLLSMKMKVCKSYPMQWILYCKIYISDLLYESSLYCCEINGFFGNFPKKFWIKCQPLHYDLVSWIFYMKRERYKVYATAFFQIISIIKCSFFLKEWSMTLLQCSNNWEFSNTIDCDV